MAIVKGPVINIKRAEALCKDFLSLFFKNLPYKAFIHKKVFIPTSQDPGFSFSHSYFAYP